MLSRLQDWTGALQSRFAWLPDWATGLILIAGAIALAQLLHFAVAFLIRRARLPQHSFIAMLLARTEGPARLAVSLLAIAIVVPAVELDPVVTETLVHLLVIAFVGFLAWIAIRAVDLAAVLYLRRYRMDAEDNLLARKHFTQVQLLKRAVHTLIVVVATAAALMTFDPVRQYGVSLFASAGAAGLVLGFAARPVLSNLIAGVQLAVTQPIRIGDSVIVEGEFGSIEDITSTYVVVKLWDLRRLIVPLTHFIEKPFQNWTRDDTAGIGGVMLQLDFSAPIERIRAKAEAIVRASPLWDGSVFNAQVTEFKERSIEVRVLVSARNAGVLWDLRCAVREQLLAFLQHELPDALPRSREQVQLAGKPGDRPGETAQAPRAREGKAGEQPSQQR
jgi:small-conductance mechanosensitive channel